MYFTTATLGMAREAIDRVHAINWDDTVAVDDINFRGLDGVDIRGEYYPMRASAQRLICRRLNIPYSYLRKCPPRIQRENLEYWLSEEPNDELFVRFRGGTVRAFFTTKYKPVDHHQVLDKLYEIGYSDDTLVEYVFDNDLFQVSFTDGTRAFDVKDDDTMFPGFSVVNSEVGVSSLKVLSYFLRLVCTNGLVMPVLERSSSYRHVRKDNLDRLPEAITAALSGVETTKNQLSLSAESHVEDPAKTFASLNKRFNVSKPEQAAVEWAWPEEQGDTMFNIIQTYTRAAQMPGLSAESALHLQDVGGRVLGLVKAAA